MVVETSVGVVKAQPDVIGGQDFFALPCLMQTVLQVSRLCAFGCNGMRWNLDGIQPGRSLTGWILEFA